MKAKSVTIQVKATEQVLFTCIMLCEVILSFESFHETKVLKCDHSNESY